MLRGADGLPIVETTFLKNPKAEYTDTYNAIMAIRFHGEQADVIPRTRLSESLRGLLDRPQLADLVIPDLARWEDWTVLPQLQSSFESIQDEASQRAVIEFSNVYLRAIAKKKVDESQKDSCEAFLANARMTHPQLFSSRFGDFGPPKP